MAGAQAAGYDTIPVALAPKALRRKLLSVALSAPEFRTELDEAALNIRNAARPAVSEATIESHFERVVYALLRDIGLKFNPEKEVAVGRRRHTARGRADSRLGALVIEYKRPSLLRTKKEIQTARGQLEEYLESLSLASDAPYTGLLTNGLVVIEVRAAAGKIVDRSAVESLTGAILLRLTQAVISLALTALTSKNLIRDFCGTETDGVLFETARLLETILSANPQPKTAMLRSEWEELFRLAHDDQSQQQRIEDRRAALATLFEKTILDSAAEYRALFALHTAYAVVLKFMAYRVVSDVYFGKVTQDFSALAHATPTALRAFCAKLEDGDIFRQIGILNLLEGDFFAWYSDKNQWTKPLADAIKAILLILARYEEARNVFESEEVPDLFRELYQATVPRAVRSSFGEVYTPYWLAEHVLDAAQPAVGWRTLDPCCGSGTFVIAAIARLRKEEAATTTRHDLLQAILKRVAAIDLHPLGVLTTRIHYFIHVSDLLELDGTEFVIPVYLGDASSIPAKTTLDGVDCLQYRLKTLKRPIDSTLPVSLVADTPKFMKLMYEYEGSIVEQDTDAAIALLTAGVMATERTPAVIAAITSLTTELVALERNGWNGIWARILSNFLTTACLGRFSTVIGNPPWIDWKNLPTGYRDRVKKMCIDRGLFSGAGRTGGINLNICALIANVSMTNWLADDGRLAFLMPRELVNQASYEGWRRIGKNGRRFVALHDWTRAGHPFDPIREDFMTFIIGRGIDDPLVPVSCFIKAAGGAKATQWRSKREALDHLNIEDKVAGQIIPGSTAFTVAANRDELLEFSVVAGSCEYIGREGIEFYPQELQLFKYDAVGPRPDTVWLRNIQVQKSKYKLPSGRILLETRYLYPLVKGPQLGPFCHDYNGLVVAFPHTSAVPTKPLPAKTLKAKSRLLLAYYNRNREVIEKQTKFSDRIRGADPGEFYGLARVGSYSFAHTHVAFRDNTRWCAAVIRSHKMPWNSKKRFVFQNHAVSMCERTDGGNVTVDEAHYVCAILNTPIVERFLNATSDERSYKVRPPVFVPLFNPKASDHRALVAGSKDAHANPEQVESLRVKMGRHYLRICRRRQRLRDLKDAQND